MPPPADPPTVEEIIAVMGAADDSPDGVRARGVIVVLCVLRGPTLGRPCSVAGIRVQLHAAAHAAGVRRRVAPHQLRHAHAVEMSREGVPLLVIQPPTCRSRDHVGDRAVKS